MLTADHEPTVRADAYAYRCTHLVPVRGGREWCDLTPEEHYGPRVYIEPRDWWIGYFRGDRFNFVCILPCLVIRWRRRLKGGS